MSNLLKVRVTKVSAVASTNGNFIHTLKTEGKKAIILGEEKTSGVLTYFLALKTAVAVGTEHELNMDQLSVTEQPMVDKDGVSIDDERGQPIRLKWLGIK
jgi:hypothetical protein